VLVISVGHGTYLVYFYIKKIMTRQSISFTKPNDEWLKAQVDSQEYSSKSELINDLIRQARKQQVQVDWLKAKLEKAEEGGFTTDSKEQILSQSKSMLNG
jgi:antitoxin ParD1/3/4